MSANKEILALGKQALKAAKTPIERKNVIDNVHNAITRNHIKKYGNIRVRTVITAEGMLTTSDLLR